MIAPAISKIDHPLEQLRVLVRSKVAFFFANRGFMRIYIQEVSKAGDQGKCAMPAELTDLFADYQRKVLELFDEGMKQGVFRKMDPALTLLAFNGCVNEVLNPSHADFPEQSKTEIEEFIFTFLQGGMIKRQE